MNYDMQGMELIPELFAVLKTAKGRNQEGASSVDGQQDHQFQEKGKGIEGELQKERQASFYSSEEAQVCT